MRDVEDLLADLAAALRTPRHPAARVTAAAAADN
jgi:hypothetical protein